MNIVRLEDKLVVVNEEVGVSVYDFNFDLHFVCSHPNYFERAELCVLRKGSIADYVGEYGEMQNIGLKLVNSPVEHEIASELEHWYPYIQDLTPRTMVFDLLPGKL